MAKFLGQEKREWQSLVRRSWMSVSLKRRNPKLSSGIVLLMVVPRGRARRRARGRNFKLEIWVKQSTKGGDSERRTGNGERPCDRAQIPALTPRALPTSRKALKNIMSKRMQAEREAYWLKPLLLV